MSRNKWTIIPFIIIASLILAAVYFISIRRSDTPAEPIKAIPLDASFILEINDFSTFHEKTSAKNICWNELRAIPEFNRIDRYLRMIDSLYRSEPVAKELVESGPSFISAHNTGKDRIDIMHVFKAPRGIGEKKIKGFMAGIMRIAGPPAERSYEGVTLYEYAGGHAGHPLAWAFTHDILMISFNSILIEDAIRQLMAGESVMDNKGFRTMYATAGKNVDANLFINFRHFPRSLSSLVLPDYRTEVRSLTGFADWAALDLNLLSEMVLMNGFVTPPDSLTSMASLFSNQLPQKITADEVLPGSTGLFLTISLSDPVRYLADFRDYLRTRGQLTSYNNLLKSITATYQVDLMQDFTDMMDNEITLAFDTGSQDTSGIFVLLRVKSHAQAEDKMNRLLVQIASAESKPLSSYTTDFRLDNEVTYKIHHLPIRNLTAKLFGNLFAALGDHYFVLIDNYLVFSSSEESLRWLIHSQVLNKTLSNDAAYKEFKNNLSPRSNLCIYCNLSKGQPVFSRWLKPVVSRQWETSLPVFQKVQVMGYQLFSNNKLLYNNLLVKYLTSYTSQTQTVWESRLDTLAGCKPVFVMNHQTKQNEVFVQDLNNNMYLINQAGRILWKVQLPEPVNSEVFQIDYFRNGKLQLLFSTRNYIFLVDRKGNFVEKYPVKLRAPATCGLSVFDYEGTRDYRLFIACSDKKVYAYTREGNLLNGWSFEQTENTVTQPVSHFRIGTKDFLVFGDGFRTYILDRKGNTRISTDTYFPRSSGNNYHLDLPRDGSSPALVTTDSTGLVYFIYFSGESKTLRLENFSGRHFFDYKDLTGDGKMEFIFLEHNQLKVFNADGSTLFTYRFREPVGSRPLFYQFSSKDRKLGVVSNRENLIYLFNNDGALYSGFPLQGNTPFSIGNFGDSLSRFNLIVGNRDNFLYNYRVK